MTQAPVPSRPASAKVGRKKKQHFLADVAYDVKPATDVFCEVAATVRQGYETQRQGLVESEACEIRSGFWDMATVMRTGRRCRCNLR